MEVWIVIGDIAQEDVFMADVDLVLTEGKLTSNQQKFPVQ
jgi:hypothetical protein